MIVGKAINMTHKLDIDILGLIENMSYIGEYKLNVELTETAENIINKIIKKIKK